MLLRTAWKCHALPWSENYGLLHSWSNCCFLDYRRGSYIRGISWGWAVANNLSALKLLQREVQCRQRHTPDISTVLQCLWQQPMGQQVQIRTLPGLLYQRVNNLRKNLRSVPECNKRCVLCTIKFGIFCPVCILLISILTLLKICMRKDFLLVMFGFLAGRDRAD